MDAGHDTRAGLGGEDRLAGLTQQQIAEGLSEIGLKEGQTALVHAAMSTFGLIQGGADTVLAALLDVLGARATLVAPTFTFACEAVEDPIIDPQNDPSEMGAISEAARLHPNARRSITYRHSFAAIGRWAEEITDVAPALSPFDPRSSFGVMLALNAQVILMGVTYNSSTTHHFAEWICDVPYRHRVPMKVRVRHPDESVVRLPMTDYQPRAYPASIAPTGPAAASQPPFSAARRFDFRRLGKMLEDRDLVGMTAIGNAIARRFAMRDLVDLAQVKAAKDCNIFRTDEGKLSVEDCTPLDFGKILISDPTPDGAGRMCQHEWSVVDEHATFRHRHAQDHSA